jgi:predicted membrane channel-forming protein YqfA (hemolysin III family)
MEYKFLQDRDGNFSSKRVFGAIVLLTGLLCHSFLGIFSIFAQPVDPGTATRAFNTMMFVGGGLLGISVFEFINRKQG